MHLEIYSLQSKKKIIKICNNPVKNLPKQTQMYGKPLIVQIKEKRLTRIEALKKLRIGDFEIYARTMGVEIGGNK